MVDLSKIFDTIFHDDILHKLKYYRVVDYELKLFKAILCDRLHKVTVDNSSSSFQEILVGLPRGSFLYLELENDFYMSQCVIIQLIILLVAFFIVVYFASNHIADRCTILIVCSRICSNVSPDIVKVYHQYILLFYVAYNLKYGKRKGVGLGHILSNSYFHNNCYIFIIEIHIFIIRT